MLVRRQTMVGGSAEPLGQLTERDGKVYARVRAHANLTARTIYNLVHVYNSTTGRVELRTAALPTSATRAFPCVAESAARSGDIINVVVSGLVRNVSVPSGNYTAGHGMRIGAGNPISTGAAASSADNEFAVIARGGTAINNVDLYLKGRECATATS